MNKSPYLDSYMAQYTELISILTDINDRTISDEPDPLIKSNINFFNKSFLVIMCSYLESYIKDVLMFIIDETNKKLYSTKLPFDLIQWSFNLKKEIKDFTYDYLTLKIKKKDLDEHISGNPYRTIELFNKFGIELKKNEVFNAEKELINSIVVKRNNVLHHNDQASDLSNQDLLNNIFTLRRYIENIDKIICSQLQ